MNTELVTAPATLPVTVAELRRNIWEVFEADVNVDVYFTELLERATAHVQTITGRKLVSQTWRGYLDVFPAGGAPIELPFGRVTAISLFAWLGADAVDHILSPTTHYIASLAGYFPKVVPVAGWPAGPFFVVDPIRIEFVAGFGAAAAVPPDLKQAVILLAAHWYKNREIVRIGNVVSPLPQAFDALVGPWRIRGV